MSSFVWICDVLIFGVCISVATLHCLHFLNLRQLYEILNGIFVKPYEISNCLSVCFRALFRLYSKISSLAGMAGKPLWNQSILVAKWLECHVKITILAGFWLYGCVATMVNIKPSKCFNTVFTEGKCMLIYEFIE